MGMRNVRPIYRMGVYGVIFFAAWMVWGFIGPLTLERAPYEVIARGDTFEVRSYPAYLVARIPVTGTQEDAIAEGSRILQRYISGDNATQASLARFGGMGVESELDAELIANSAPIIQEAKGSSYFVSFVLPSRYRIADLPRPHDPRIRMLEIPQTTVAIMSFRGIASPERIDAAERDLRNALMQEKYLALSSLKLIGYNPTFMPSFLRSYELALIVR